VKGGLPGKGRNNGARKATQKIILFLDADVVLPPEFLEKTFFEKKLDIASCLVVPRSKNKKDKVIVTLWNSYFLFLEKLAPHVCGFCIFVKKAVHTKINGFDESILIAEDVDYVQRTVKIGAQFSFLDSQKIPISLRRFIEEGRLKLIMKHVGITLHTLFLGQVRKNIFEYKFGQHEKI
jgi:GT2 family glycosyltransferase